MDMTNTNATNFRQNMFAYLNQAIEFNDVITVNTKNGNAVVMSEEDYNGLMETLYLNSIHGLKEKIQEGMSEPIEEMVDADDLEW